MCEKSKTINTCISTNMEIIILNFFSKVLILVEIVWWKVKFFLWFVLRVEKMLFLSGSNGGVNLVIIITSTLL